MKEIKIKGSLDFGNQGLFMKIFFCFCYLHVFVVFK